MPLDYIDSILVWSGGKFAHPYPRDGILPDVFASGCVVEDNSKELLSVVTVARDVWSRLI